MSQDHIKEVGIGLLVGSAESQAKRKKKEGEKTKSEVDPTGFRPQDLLRVRQT